MSNKKFKKQIEPKSHVLFSLNFCQQKNDLLEIIDLIEGTENIEKFSLFIPYDLEKCNSLIDVLLLFPKNEVVFSTEFDCEKIFSKLSLDHVFMEAFQSDIKKLLSLKQQNSKQKFDNEYIKFCFETLDLILKSDWLNIFNSNKSLKWNEEHDDFLCKTMASKKFNAKISTQEFINTDESLILRNVLEKYIANEKIKKSISQLATNRAEKIFLDLKLDLERNYHLYYCTSLISQFYLLQESSCRILISNKNDFFYELYYGYMPPVVNKIYKFCGGRDLFMTTNLIIDDKQKNELFKETKTTQTEQICIINDDWETSCTMSFIDTNFSNMLSHVLSYLNAYQELYPAIFTSHNKFPTTFSFSSKNGFFAVKCEFIIKSIGTENPFSYLSNIMHMRQIKMA